MTSTPDIPSASPAQPAEALDQAVLNSIVQESADCIKVLDLDARLLSMNAGGQQTMEIDDFSVCQNLLWPDFWQGDDRLRVEAALDRARAGQRSTFEGQAATFKGTPRWWEVRVAPVLDEHGTVQQLLAVSRDVTARKQAELALMALNADLERQVAERTRELTERNAELVARTQALQAFSNLTRDLALHGDPITVIGRAQQTVLGLLPPSFAIHWELRGDTWRVASQVGDLRDPALQVVVNAGVPYHAGQTHVIPWESRRPYYQDAYDPDSDDIAVRARAVRATASLPLLVNGEVRGVFGVGVFDSWRWTPVDKAVLETVVGSLGLALERVEQARQLDVERGVLDERTRALQRANEELEAFSSSVSHDLRTPVRHIAGFSDLLSRALEGQLDAKADRYLKVIGEAAARMDILIDALLALARTSRLPLQLEPVDLGALVARVRRELEPDERERAVVWQVGPLPPVTGDRVLLSLALSNLLSNALKYSRMRDEACIEVWAEEREREWALFVRDNGVGFNPRYADKLFGVFQRLHRAEDFEGTGVGLANVRLIVQRHGGTVFARSPTGEGATFGFTLPKQD